MAGGKQQIDFRRPRPDAGNGDQPGHRIRRGSSVHRSSRSSPSATAWATARRRLLLRPRQAGLAEHLVAGGEQPSAVSGSTSLVEAAEDGARARRRDLLRHDDRGEAVEAGLRQPERNLADPGANGCKPRIDQANASSPSEISSIEAIRRIAALVRALRASSNLLMRRFNPAFCRAMSQPVFRFAPSPNGELHLGHALSALLNSEWAARTRRAFPAADRGHRPRRAARPNTSRASMTTSPGWASAGRSRPRRQSEHFADYKAVLDLLIARGARLSGLHEPQRDPRLHLRGRDAEEAVAARSRRRAALSRRRPRTVVARTPPARRVGRALCLAARRGGRTRAASARRCRGRSSRPNSPTSRRRSMRSPRNGATSCWRARTCRPAITFRSSSTTPRKASPMSCAAATSTRRRRSSGCCRSCSAIPRRLYFHHHLVEGPDGRKLSKSENDTGLQRLRDSGATPADISRLVGLV